ncbi:hypothetical protein [Microbaculum sp. FT89]|uniref:hypothetical protein n=1 Tax=Microbaculum sp. FT89 TaxID=3447298 RepID=UPI003F53317D
MMPRNSSEDPVEGQSKPHEESSWCGIGINAVAAAQMCKPHDHDRRERETEPCCFPFVETEFATD